jgi:hypothetical protein
LNVERYAQHGLSGTPEYKAFACAKIRCTHPNAKRYKDYGGRGIEFRFSSFEEFLTMLGPRPEGMTLDRINNDGHYEPGNVRWATWSEQNKNRRSFTPGFLKQRSEGARTRDLQMVF